MEVPGLLAAAGLAETARETARTFGLNWPHFIAQCISFAIVAFVLHRYAYRPILRVLEERRQRIAESLANADRIKEELARTEEAMKKRLADADAQAKKYLEEARAAANKERERLMQEAVNSANQFLQKAREANEAEWVRMRDEARREIGRLVIEATARVTGKILTLEDQRRLIEETNRQLAA